jgi:thioredoxin-related protein
MKRRFYVPALLLTLFLFGITPAENTGSTGNSGIDKTKPAVTAKTDIDWQKYDDGLAQAKKEGKKVFVEFTAKWCGWCKRMHATTFKDPDIVGLLNKYYVTVSVDGDSRDTLDIDGYITSERRLAREYRVTGYPTYWFLTPEADPIAPVKGYRDAKTLGNILDYLKDDQYKTVKYEDFIRKKQNGDKTEDKNKDKDK